MNITPMSVSLVGNSIKREKDFHWRVRDTTVDVWEKGSGRGS